MAEYLLSLILQLGIFVLLPALVWWVEEIIKMIFLDKELYAEELEERNERYEKYFKMFEEMKKG